MIALSNFILGVLIRRYFIFKSFEFWFIQLSDLEVITLIELFKMFQYSGSILMVVSNGNEVLIDEAICLWTSCYLNKLAARDFGN